MDGVVTRTARLHAAAWKATFDPFLKARARPGEDTRPFDEEGFDPRASTRQRRSQARPASAALARQRSCIARSLVSLTWMRQTRPSHCGAARQTRSSAARSGSTGIA